MIHIEKDQKIAENENLRVATATGDYDDTALIEFYDINKPGIVMGCFQAQFIKYGGMVYTFNDPKELGAAILVVDPNSTHSAASYVRMTNELLVQMNGGTLESSSLDQVKAVEQEKVEEAIENPVIDNTSTSSTPSGLEPVIEGTTTAPVVEEIVSPETQPTNTSVPTSTETSIPTNTPSDAATTTPNVIDETIAVVEEIAETTNTVTSTTEAITEAIETIADSATSSTP